MHFGWKSMTDIIWGSTKKPITTQRLAAFLEQHFPEEGTLYVGYPVLTGPEGVGSVDALWISPGHGVVIFDLCEGPDPTNYKDRQDELANNLETRFRSHKVLMQGR